MSGRLGQRIVDLSGDDLNRLEKQRGWVRDHYKKDAERQYETLEGKLSLLDTIIRSKWIEPHETWKLQSLGVTLGDALAQKLDLTWVMVEDEHGRDPALRLDGTSIVLFPLTSISKRAEKAEPVNVRSLFEWYCRQMEELKTRGA
jgi:hypothetical protein